MGEPRSWPKKINRPYIQNLFRLAFVAAQTNIVLIGNVGCRVEGK